MVRRTVRARVPRRGDDQGQNQLEYIGLAVLVGVLVVVLAAVPAFSALAPKFKQAVCRVLGKQCGASGEHGGLPEARSDKYYKPILCMKARQEEVAGGKISLGFIEIGEKFGLIRREMANGQVWLTFTDTASIKAETGAGGKLKLGKGFDDKVEVSGGLRVGYGDTWVFDSPEEAKKFRDDLRELKTREYARRFNPRAGLGYAIQDLVDGDTPHPPDPNITFGKVGYEVAAEAALGTKYTSSTGKHAKGRGRHRKPTTIDLNTGVHLEVNVKGDVTVADRHLRGEHTRAWTYKFTGNLTGRGQVAGIGGEYTRTQTGAMRIVRNEKGELARIDFINLTESGVGASFGHQQKTGKGKSGKGRAKHIPTDVNVTTTRLPIKSNQQRRVAEEWLDANGGKVGAVIGSMSLAFDDKVKTTAPGPEASAFNQLLYREAKVMKVDYNKVTNVQKFGAEIKAGWTFGFEMRMESSDQHSYDARYLGAPRGSRRDYVDFPQCEVE